MIGVLLGPLLRLKDVVQDPIGPGGYDGAHDERPANRGAEVHEQGREPAPHRDGRENFGKQVSHSLSFNVRFNIIQQIGVLVQLGEFCGKMGVWLILGNLRRLRGRRGCKFVIRKTGR